MLVVFTTTPETAEATKLAERLVGSKLAACVQIVPQIISVYAWEAKIEKTNEQLLLIKTTEDKFGELEKFISENHSYDVPEIVAIEAAHISRKYLNWVERTLSE